MATSDMTPEQARLAIRQEVYDAVLDEDGGQWSNIGLVSVSGHAVEEEL